VLAAYGIGGNAAGQLVHSAAEAEAAARAMARPTALKVQSANIPHKTEAGAVALNISGDGARAAYESVLVAAKKYAPAARIDGVLVQPMAAPGREVILGVNRDPNWGPLLMVGLGGVLVEALGDVALAPVPLDHAGARALLGRLKASAVLGPFRGSPPADTDALVELMVRLSLFAADYADEIAEIDLNPVIVHAKGQGVSLVDALIVKQPPRPAHSSAAE
jgi:acyl-CoA synthetase (NDP forming)